jgi:hypothetical protein
MNASGVSPRSGATKAASIIRDTLPAEPATGITPPARATRVDGRFDDMTGVSPDDLLKIAR